MNPHKWREINHIFPDHFLTTPQSFLGKKSRYSFDKYSDGIANGDAADDKQLEFEHDPNSLVTDYNGHTNRGYGAMNPHKWREINHIFPDHFLTVPQSFSQLGNKYSFDRYSDSIANGDSADDKDLHEEEDVNDAVVDLNGSTSRGYGHMVPRDFRSINHIFPGYFVTKPRA